MQPQLLHSSAKADIIDHPWLTIFTATYNREDKLQRAYDSLCAMQHPVNKNTGETEQLEWLIIDDGSTDATEALVEKWCKEDKLPIRYYRQPNQGKHIAMNHGAQLSRGYMFAILDSDDAYFPNAFNVWYSGWESLTDEERQQSKGVTARCADPVTGQLVGTPLPHHPFFENALDLRYKYNVRGEMRGTIRTEIMRRYPFPTISEGSRFCPEAIVWIEMGKNYKELVVDEPVGYYYADAGNALTKGGSINRARENFYLWQTMINECLFKYLGSNPKEMIKAVVGISRDGFLTGRTPGQILKSVKGWREKVLVTTLMGPAALLAILKK